MSPAPGRRFRAVSLDVYGTLLRNEDLVLIPRRMVADHGLAAGAEDLLRRWLGLYHEAIRRPPFRSLRAIHGDILGRLLREAGAAASPAPYVEMFFELTTAAAAYEDAAALPALLDGRPCALVSNADLEHQARWTLPWPPALVLVSEAVRAYKPDPRPFQAALEALGLAPAEVLHVGDSELDDVAGARAAGLAVAWINRDGRPRRPGLPAPDFELPDLCGLAALL